MARERSPARSESEKLYLNSKGKMRLVDIAAKLNLKDSQIRKWKSQDKWDDKLGNKSIGALPKSNSNVTNELLPLNDNVSWIEIENEYVTDIRKKPYTLESLSEKYNIPFKTIEDYSYKNKWKEKREKYKGNVREKSIKKTIEIVSCDIAAYQAKHINISDKIFNEINKALDNPDELYTVVEKLRQGYGQGEFKESIETEVLDVINDAKVVNIVNALDRLQKMQRQTLGILDEKDKLRLGNTDNLSDYEKERQKLELENKKLQNARLEAEIHRLKGDKNVDKDTVQIVDDIDD